jgi:hypothetical protein
MGSSLSGYGRRWKNYKSSWVNCGLAAESNLAASPLSWPSDARTISFTKLLFITLSHHFSHSRSRTISYVLKEILLKIISPNSAYWVPRHSYPGMYSVLLAEIAN